MAFPNLNELNPGVINVAKHIEQVNPSSIIISGASAEYTLALLQAQWKKLFEKDIPEITNLGIIGNLVLYGYPEDAHFPEELRPSFIRGYLKCCAPELIDLQSEKLIYLDDHSKSGYKIGEIQRNMGNSGFQSLTSAVYCAGVNIVLPEETFVGLRSDELSDKVFDWGISLQKI